MRPFVYFARFEPIAEHLIVVRFPDVPEAATVGDSPTDAHTRGEAALTFALLTYVARGLPIPRPNTRGGGNLVAIAVEPTVAAKIAAIEAFRESGMSKLEFARALGKHKDEARRILDPRHPTKLSTLAAALRVLGKQLVIAVDP
jgi:antitoxin HicB